MPFQKATSTRNCGKYLESVSSLVRGMYTVVTDLVKRDRDQRNNCVQRRANGGVKSVRENHQPRIKHDGEEDVAPCYDGERPDDGPGGSRDLPPGRKKAAGEDTYHPK